MPETKTKLARALSASELDALCAELSGVKGLNGVKLMAIAKKRGVSIGHSAAAVFLNKEFEPYLERMRRRSQVALFVQEHSKPEDIATLADASAGELSQQVFEFLSASENADSIDLSTKDGRKTAEQLTRIIAKIRTGDHKLRELTARLEEFERERAAERAKYEQLTSGKRIGDLSDDERAEVLDFIDERMGIHTDKKKGAKAA